VGRFAGRFRHRDGEVRLNPTTTVEEVLARLGEPYWRNEDEDEVILFYEDDPVETQFEFPDKKHLGFITILMPPLLADPIQHKAYGVTKPWPPGRPG
jgi:hypothetical protein